MSHRKNTPTHPLKTQAKSLRTHLGAFGWDLTHSQSLEAIAKTHGYKDWNTASASIAITGAEPELPPLWTIFKTDDGLYEANWGMNHVGTHETRQEAVAEARSVWSEQVGIPWPEYVAMRVGITRQKAYDEGQVITTHMDFRPWQLEHWLVPRNSDAAYEPVYNRVMKLLKKDAKVALFDCGQSVRPDRWKDAFSWGGFLGICSTPTRESLWKRAKQIALNGADLIVLLKPGHIGPVPSNDWFTLLNDIMRLSPDTHVLVVSGGRDEGGIMTAFTPEWTRMAGQEWVLKDPRGSKLQKHLHLKDLRCPHCSSEIERRLGQFFSRSVGEYPGLVCVSCESLWDDPNHSFMRAISKKEVTVNGKKFRVGDKLPYDLVIDMAGVSYDATVTYFCKASKRSGSLIAGETIHVDEGMHFTATVTGNA